MKLILNLKEEFTHLLDISYYNSNYYKWKNKGCYDNDILLLEECDEQTETSYWYECNSKLENRRFIGTSSCYKDDKGFTIIDYGVNLV